MRGPAGKKHAAIRLGHARRLIEMTAKQLKGEGAEDDASKSARRLEEIAKQLEEIEGELGKAD